MVPQSYPAEYIGKQGASVPSTRTISELCPARQPQSCRSPWMKSFICARRCTEFTMW